MKRLILFFSIAILSIPLVFAQDTLIIYNNYKWRLGLKGSWEKSGVLSLTPNEYNVYNYGVQGIRNLKNGKLLLETGVYKISRVSDQTYYYITPWDGSRIAIFPINYHYISIPLACYYQTKIFYFSAGPYFDYLIGNTPEQKEGQFSEITIIMQKEFNRRKFNFGTSVAIGIDKTIDRTITIFVEGKFSHNILSNNSSSSDYKPKFSNYGLALGANYKLLK